MPEPDERPANPFQRLRDLLGPLPAGPAPAEASKENVAGFPHSSERLTVRFERAGHGGKTVTRVEGPALRAADVGAFAKELARALGVGARAEGGDVLVQGDQCARLVEWLARRGFANVRRGN